EYRESKGGLSPSPARFAALQRGSALDLGRAEELHEHEILQPRVIPLAGGQHDVAAQPRRLPQEVLGLVLADDRDHLADYGEPEVAVVAFPDLDHLRGVPAYVLVPAVKEELGVAVAHALDLEDAPAALRRVRPVGRRAVQPQVGRDRPVAAGRVVL